MPFLKSSLKEQLKIFLFYFFFFTLYFHKVLFNINNRVFGSFSDQVRLIWHIWWEKYIAVYDGPLAYAYFPLTPFDKTSRFFFQNQPVLRVMLKVISQLSNEIVAYNLLIFIAFPLSSFFMYLLINNLTKDRLVALAAGLIFSFSPYMSLHAKAHVDLTQIWVLPLGILALTIMLRKKSWIWVIGTALVFSFVALISNYYGYFMALFAVFYSISHLLIFRRELQKGWFIKRVLLFLSLYGVIAGSIILASTNVDIKELYNHEKEGKGGNTLPLSRTLEDFVTFSSRPWHYFLPPAQHPQIGFISKDFNSWLKDSKSYFLFENYFPEEHSGSYLGITLLLLFIVTISKYWRKKQVRIFSYTALVFLILSAPPFFTLVGRKIYLPSFLLMKWFPMFRVISRFSVFVFISFLVVISFGLSEMLREKSKKAFFLLVVLSLSIYEFYIPVGSFKAYPPPEVYSWLSSQKDFFIIMEYPYGATGESVFWQRIYKKGLLNPRGLAGKDFESKRFTEKFIDSEENIDKLGVSDVKFILVHENQLRGDRVGERDFFYQAENLRKIKQFKDVSVFEVL